MCTSFLLLLISFLLSPSQIERAKIVKAQFIKKAEREAKEGRKAGDILADGVIVGLGLISKEGGSGGE